MSVLWRRIWMIIGLVCIALLVVNNFTSNPYEKYRAKTMLESYLNEKYPDRAFTVTAGKYNRDSNYYEFDVLDKFNDKDSYDVKIENGDNYAVLEDGVKKSIVDKETSTRLSLEASNSIKALFEKKLPEITSVTADIEVAKRTDGNEYAKWEPNFDAGNSESAAKLSMDVDVTGMEKDDLMLISTEAYKILADADVNYSTATLSGYKVKGGTGDKKWEYAYTLEFAKNQKPKSVKTIAAT